MGKRGQFLYPQTGMVTGKEQLVDRNGRRLKGIGKQGAFVVANGLQRVEFKPKGYTSSIALFPHRQP